MSQSIDPADYGFGDPAELRAAAAGWLAHLARLGITHLPSADAAAAEGLPALAVGVAAAEGTIPETAAPERVVPEASGPPSAASANPTPTHAAPPPAAAAPRATVRQPTAAAPVGRLSPASAVQAGPESYDAGRLPIVEAEGQLQAWAAEVAGCVRCPALVRSRRQTVFGEGHAAPRVCFFGEAPGADEDRSGRPFVGRAGQLLTKMIEACTLSREEVYILNTVKCRPPENRNPQLDEVENCRGYFEQQLEILQPEYIVCLGLISARALLHTTASVGRLRGVFHRYRSSKVLVTYHPAYLLRNPEAKRAAWEDLQIMLRDMGIDPKANRRGG